MSDGPSGYSGCDLFEHTRSKRSKDKTTTGLVATKDHLFRKLRTAWAMVPRVLNGRQNVVDGSWCGMLRRKPVVNRKDWQAGNDGEA